MSTAPLITNITNVDIFKGGQALDFTENQKKPLEEKVNLLVSSDVFKEYFDSLNLAEANISVIVSGNTIQFSAEERDEKLQFNIDQSSVETITPIAHKINAMAQRYYQYDGNSQESATPDDFFSTTDEYYLLDEERQDPAHTQTHLTYIAKKERLQKQINAADASLSKIESNVRDNIQSDGLFKVFNHTFNTNQKAKNILKNIVDLGKIGQELWGQTSLLGGFLNSTTSYEDIAINELLKDQTLFEKYISNAYKNDKQQSDNSVQELVTQQIYLEQSDTEDASGETPLAKLSSCQYELDELEKGYKEAKSLAIYEDRIPFSASLESTSHFTSEELEALSVELALYDIGTVDVQKHLDSRVYYSDLIGFCFNEAMAHKAKNRRVTEEEKIFLKPKYLKMLFPLPKKQCKDSDETTLEKLLNLLSGDHQDLESINDSFLSAFSALGFEIKKDNDSYEITLTDNQAFTELLKDDEYKELVYRMYNVSKTIAEKLSIESPFHQALSLNLLKAKEDCSSAEKTVLFENQWLLGTDENPGLFNQRMN